MATWQEIIDEAKTQLYEAIKSPKPSYSVGEFKVDRNAWIKHLQDTIKQAQEMQNAEEPAQEVTFLTDEWL